MSYLRRNSSHPPHIFSSLPYGEFVRIRRNCSDLDSYDKHSATILHAFQSRGYKLTDLTTAHDKARSLARHDLLSKYDSVTQPSNLIAPVSELRNHYLILPYHLANHQIRKVINDNWQLLGTSEATMTLHNSKIIFGNRRPSNLKDMLVTATIPLKPPKPGTSGKRSHACDDPTKCVYCPQIDTSGTICSFVLNKRFLSKYNATCNSHNIVYCLQCLTCGIQYVGQTKRTFRERLYEHFLNIRKKNRNDPIGRHFQGNNHLSNPQEVKAYILAFIPIPANSPDALQMRLRVENDWIYRLRTSLPLGLNAMD